MACPVADIWQWPGRWLPGGQVWVRKSKEGKGGRWSFSEGKSGSFMYFTHDRCAPLHFWHSTSGHNWPMGPQRTPMDPPYDDVAEHYS